MYSLSISAVFCFSLYVAESCPFVPVMVIFPSSRFILLLGVLCSSSPSAAISAIIVKMVANFLLDAEIIFVTLSVVGIMGVPSVSLKYGFSY